MSYIEPIIILTGESVCLEPFTMLNWQITGGVTLDEQLYRKYVIA
ncbi:hypothetical protein [Rubellicoccus peritrichatus]|uniref:Uncharacterized protein n=1 Tax=Rubellicoccus peritrichatus TaxID=3080537 RepID=A0AAQ3LBS5_9BACT|nr:hypothetical protein [Puniceicoccus sp. CR14]WOO40975.1 hypothetical protein RZN69_20340 [Puniceicoccus sp. CR14]